MCVQLCVQLCVSPIIMSSSTAAPNPLASLASSVGVAISSTVSSTLSSPPGSISSQFSSASNNMSTMSWNGEAHYFEESITPMTVRTMLSSSHVDEKIKGSKWLLAMMSKVRHTGDQPTHMIDTQTKSKQPPLTSQSLSIIFFHSFIHSFRAETYTLSSHTA